MSEAVNHPAHYTDGKYEVIDFIEQNGLGFHLGNAVKYICRAGKKDQKKELEDLEKAIWYLKRAQRNIQDKVNRSTIYQVSANCTCASPLVIEEPKDYHRIDILDFLEDKKLGYHRSKALDFILKGNWILAIIELEEELELLDFTLPIDERKE